MSTLVGYMLLRGLFGVFDSMLCAITFLREQSQNPRTDKKGYVARSGGLKKPRFCFILLACETAIMGR